MFYVTLSALNIFSLLYIRKGYHSINAMIVGDSDLRIRYVNASEPGAAHDSRLFNESFLKRKLEESFSPANPSYLLGDEGYACSRVLLTPIREDRVKSKAERKYNVAHKKSRIYIEHLFGVLKSRYPCLHSGLRTSMSNNLKIIMSCCILHNICILFKEPAPEQLFPDEDNVHVTCDVNDQNESFHMRNRIISLFE